MEKHAAGQFGPCGPGYLYDESRLQGRGDFIVFPEDAAQAADAVRRAVEQGLPITIQGARTGIAGGAVPRGGLVLSSERMNRPLEISAGTGDTPVLRVQAGMNFETLENFLRRAIPPEDWDTESAALFRERFRNLRFPPNPTETSATLGGAFGTNARGPNSPRWGGVGDHVRGLVWINPAGKTWEIRRGQYCFDETGCPLPGGGRLSCDTGIPAGGSRFLHPRPGLDLLDFFAGSEGLTGFAAELSLGLKALPAAVWGVVYFFKNDRSALDFAESLRERWKSPGGEALSTLEYYDRPSLELVRTGASQSAALRQIPPIDPGAEAALQVELEGEDSDVLESLLMEQLELFLAGGGREEDTWAAASPAELEKFRILRHAVPELINMELDRIRRDLPELHKTAGDFMVKPELAGTYREMYRRDLAEAGLRGFVFGHIAEGRLHVNILPENPEELRRSRILLDRWAASILKDGGLLAAENGIGRLKLDLLRRRLPPERLEQIRSILRALDPRGILGGFGFTEG